MKKVLFVVLSVFLIIGCEEADVFYVSNVNVVDVATGDILREQVIQIEDGIITDIADDIALPDKIENHFNGSGMFVSPGLSDMNVFLNKKMADIEYWGVHPGDRMLAAGITTIRASRFFKDPGLLIESEDEFRGNSTVGPEIIKSTVANYTSGKDIENLIDEIAYAEADYINMMNIISEKVMNNILNYADEHDIYTCGNVFSYNDFLRCSKMGFDELTKVDKINILLMDDDFAETIDWYDEKDFWKKYDIYYSGFYDQSEEEIIKKIEPKLNMIIEVMKSNDIGVTTALFVDEISSMKIEEPEKYLEYAEKHNIPNRGDSIYLYTKTVLGDHFRLEQIPDYVVFKEKLGKITLSELKENEVFLLAGTGLSSDAWYGVAPGLALHEELRIMTECGFSNLEALQTATLNASIVGEKMGVTERWGRVEPGFLADLVFTAENPLDNIEVLRAPEYVMKSGELYSDNELQLLR